MTISTKGFELYPWQQNAVEAWEKGTDGTPHRGTLEIVTGGGKTVIALRCLAVAAHRDPNLRAAIVVPTEALARQWRTNLLEKTSLGTDEVGLLGAGGKASFETARVIVAVINTASKVLPEMAAASQPLMLIVDECHRAGAPKYQRVLNTPARYRLGLSATPDREELDDSGEPLSYDEQAVGQKLGGVVYRFTLKDARLAGWLPEFTLHHHGIQLSPDERREYDALSRRVDEAGDELRGQGFETGRARSLASRRDGVGDAARRWVQLTAQRKDLLYRAAERHRVTGQILQLVFRNGPDRRVILFHERVAEAVELYESLGADLGVRVELEHSKLPDRRRTAALAAFSSGEAPVLVSVKSLVEGIDVPEADTGVSVASSSSVRQRVQALGRVLRRAVSVAGEAKKSTMHLLYVADTVDDLIYAKADWVDLTGANSNRYWTWALDEGPAEQPAPPRTPLPTEEQVWEQLGGRLPTDLPAPWPGVPTGLEYSVKTNGAVHNSFGAQMANPQNAADMVRAVRGRSGGKFRVTPEHRLVLVWQPGDEAQFLLAGQLAEPFATVPEQPATEFEVESLKPGDAYPGPGDKKQGTFKVTQRAGGLIEKKVRGGAVIALTEETGDAQGERNARHVLAAWETLNRSFSRFFVNTLGHAWTEGPSGRVFLAEVPGGFVWPEGETS